MKNLILALVMATLTACGGHPHYYEFELANTVACQTYIPPSATPTEKMLIRRSVMTNVYTNLKKGEMLNMAAVPCAE